MRRRQTNRFVARQFHHDQARTYAHPHVRVSLALLLACLSGLAAPFAVQGGTVRAAGTVPWTYKGFTIEAHSADDLASSATLASLRQLAATGANTVIFTLTWYVDSVSSTTVHRTVITGSDASLVTVIGEAKALGLKVVIKPHVDSADAQWRARINPCASFASDSSPCPAGDPQVAAWFASYDAMVVHYGDIAQQTGADALCIGAELIDMSTNPNNVGQWRALISTLRGRFNGKLTYSGNWGSGSFATEYTRIPFWDALDYIGLSAYFPLATTYSPTVADMVSQWVNVVQPQIAAVQRRVGKPVIFTEDGYRSVAGAAVSPSTYSGLGPYSGQVQADCYQATFEAWASVPWFAGGWFWEWGTSPSVGGAGDTTYFVQNKPAQAVITNAFGGNGTVPPAATAGAPTATTVPRTMTPTATTAPAATDTPASTSTPLPAATATATQSETPSPVATATTTAAPIVPTSVPATATAVATVSIHAPVASPTLASPTPAGPTATQRVEPLPATPTRTVVAPAATATADTSVPTAKPTVGAVDATATIAAIATSTVVSVPPVGQPRPTATRTSNHRYPRERAVVVRSLSLSATRITPHRLLVVRAVIDNGTSRALRLRNAAFFLRYPVQGLHGRPQVRVVGTSGALTLASHASYTLTRSYRFSIYAPHGIYLLYLSWKTLDGRWHDQQPRAAVRLAAR